MFDMRKGAPLALVAAACLLAATGGGRTRAAEAGTGGLPRGAEPVTLDPATFTTQIDNPWSPMRPGTRWRYRETDADGTTQDVVVTVTDRVKRIADGVTARVVRDTGSVDGRIVEDTLDYFAQDAHGTVWYLGEDTAEFEHGVRKSTAGSFEAGVDGAMAGVAMPAHPRAGQAYRQEYHRGDAEDRGAVLSVHERAQTPAGRFPRAVLTKDTSPLEPTVLEYKLYAPGVGLVLTLGVSGGPGGREELVRVGQAPAAWVRQAGERPLGQGPIAR